MGYEVTDEMVEAMRKGRDAAQHIQGFHYTPHLVIRDLRKGPSEQEVWRCHEGRRASFETELSRRKDAEKIAAVAPLLEAQARAAAIEEAAKVAEGDGWMTYWHGQPIKFCVARAIRDALLSRPVSERQEPREATPDEASQDASGYYRGGRP